MDGWIDGLPVTNGPDVGINS